MCYNDLERTKKSIIKKRRLRKFVAGYELFMSLLLFTAGATGGSSLVAILVAIIGIVLFVLFIFSFSNIIEGNNLSEQLSYICDNQALNKTYEKQIHCRKIKLYTRYFAKRSSYVFGIVLIDENKNKYYYFFDEKIMWIYSINYKSLKNKFCKDIDILCFKNTSIIKTMENDPYFLQFTNDSFAL